jgi:hypothetical protein
MTKFVEKKITFSPLQQQYISIFIFIILNFYLFLFLFLKNNYDVGSLANNIPRGI